MTELITLAGASAVGIRNAMTAGPLGRPGGSEAVAGKPPLPGKVMWTAK